MRKYVDSVSDVVGIMNDYDSCNFDIVVDARAARMLVSVEQTAMGRAVNGSMKEELILPTIDENCVILPSQKCQLSTPDGTISPGMFHTSHVVRIDLTKNNGFVHRQAWCTDKLAKVPNKQQAIASVPDNDGWIKFWYADRNIMLVPTRQFLRQALSLCSISGSAIDKLSNAAVAALLNDAVYNDAKRTIVVRAHAGKDAYIARALFTTAYTRVNNNEVIEHVDKHAHSKCRITQLLWEPDEGMTVDYITGMKHEFGSGGALVGFEVSNSETGKSVLSIAPRISLRPDNDIDERDLRVVFPMQTMKHAYKTRSAMLDSIPDAINRAIDSAANYVKRVDDASNTKLNADTIDRVVKRLRSKYQLTLGEVREIRSYHDLYDRSALGVTVALSLASARAPNRNRSNVLARAAGDVLINKRLTE